MTPELPVSPALPGEPSVLDVGMARVWLAKRNVFVSLPTRLLSHRIAAREDLRGRDLNRRSIITFLVIFAAVSGTGVLFEIVLAGTPGDFVNRSALYALVVSSYQLVMWRTVRRRDRFAQGLVPQEPKPLLMARLKLLGRWYLAGLTSTFVGGAALGVALALGASPSLYGWSWLAVLAIGAVPVGMILKDVLTGPAIAEDPASLAVDDALRLQDAYFAAPPVYALLLVIEPYFSGRHMDFFTPWLIAYVVLALGTHLVGELQRWRHRSLPPGYYGRE